MARLLGIDVGNKRIGVAVSDPNGLIASSLVALERKGKRRDIAAILDLAHQQAVTGIVVGIPVSLDGNLHLQGNLTKSFFSALHSESFLPIVTCDESFSTDEAESRLRQIGAKPSRERGRVDAAAAAIILQRYLDAHQGKIPTNVEEGRLSR